MRRCVHRAVGFGAVLALLAASGCKPGLRSETPPRKGVITFGPNITETVYALGEGDRIVGVTTFCDYPPEAKTKAAVGGYLDPNLEKISLLAPDLIILPGEHEKVAMLARARGFQVLHAHMDSLTSIETGIRDIGAALGCPEKAAALWRRMRRELDAVRSAVSREPPVKTLIVNARPDHDLNNVFTVGRASFLSELLQAAGGENIFHDVDQAYFEASKESIVMRAPEVIIEFHAGETVSEEEQTRFIADWDALPAVPAVKNGRVHLLLESYGLRPGPRIALIAARLASMLHPNVAVSLP
jgi:iron complex transport system substrate-binding protein